MSDPNNTRPRTRTYSVADGNSLASSTDGGQLSTVHEVPWRKQSKESRVNDTSSIAGLPANKHITSRGHSRDASPGSTIAQYSTEKLAEPLPRRLKHKPQTIGVRERNAWSKDLTPSQNGTYRDSMAGGFPNPASPKRPKNRGLRAIIRRMFGRSSVKNRISMPAPATYHNVQFTINLDVVYANFLKDPNTFITSATDLMAPRSASTPSHQVSRSSALGSHAPFSLKVPAETADVEFKVPPRPERPPPMRPSRPRRASLPSIILNAQEMDAVEVELTGLGLQDVRDNAGDAANIGFAVTNGSNPKRRSRSAGTFYDTSKEHRMSPIQWRQWRRRSDEIRYWRESTDANSPILGNTTSIGSEFLQISPAHSHGKEVAKESLETTDEPDEETENHGNFNFGLPAGAMEQQEQIGIEERMVTFEIKLMDFEYAISKLQAGLASPAFQGPHSFQPTDHLRRSQDSDHRNLPIFSPYQPNRPSDDSYLPSNRSTPASQPYQRSFQPINPPITPTLQQHPNDRPASAATTLKAGARDRTSRASATGLTTEHYTSLIALFRREHSARLRLEDQVSLLQRQVDLLSNAQSSAHGPRRFSDAWHHSPERVASATRGRYRRRSSRYSQPETDTDTDDASFHEVYVTPVERGEFERETLAAEEEGVAF